MHCKRQCCAGFIKGIFLQSLAGITLAFLWSCETIVYWQDLPAPSHPRVVWVKGDDESITRAVALTKKLVDVKPLAASLVFVMTNEYWFTREKLARIPDRAHTARCWLVNEIHQTTIPPSAACIWLPGNSVDRLSDEALAAVIAHELGHIERGHKSWTGAAEPTLIQWEADEAAMQRLNLAGFCAGAAMRKYAAEIVSSDAGRLVHPWRDYSPECKPKSP
jgi:peptidase M48-like protein